MATRARVHPDAMAKDDSSSQAPWRASPDDSAVTEGLAGTTVLLVDDDDDFRAITADVLMRFGLCVIEADSGREALARAERDEPEIVLLDHRMPGMTGAQVAAALRQNGCAATVILVTAARDAGDIAHSAGVALWLQKPFSLDDLREVLQRARIARDPDYH